MKFKIIPKEELQDLIKSGKAKKIHLTGIENTLRPRGPLQKESIGLTILERLVSNYEFWSDPSYSDNPGIKEFLYYLKNNLDSEVSAAWSEFLKMISTSENTSMEEAWKLFWERRDNERS